MKPRPACVDAGGSAGAFYGCNQDVAGLLARRSMRTIFLHTGHHADPPSANPTASSTRRIGQETRESMDQYNVSCDDAALLPDCDVQETQVL